MQQCASVMVDVVGGAISIGFADAGELLQEPVRNIGPGGEPAAPPKHDEFDQRIAWQGRKDEKMLFVGGCLKLGPRKFSKKR